MVPFESLVTTRPFGMVLVTRMVLYPSGLRSPLLPLKLELQLELKLELQLELKLELKLEFKLELKFES